MKQGCSIHGRQLRHQWTDYDKTVLALLHLFYDNSDDEYRKIWSHLVSDILTLEGFPLDGYSLSAFSSQLWRLEKNEDVSEAWNNILGTPLPYARKLYTKIKDRIEHAAQDLQIQLHLRVEIATPRVATTALNETRRKRPLSVAHIDDWSESSEDEDEDLPQLTKQNTKLNASRIQSFAFDPNAMASTPQTKPSVTRREVHESEHSGRPKEKPLLRLQDLSDPTTPRRSPALLFRTFQTSHGFLARRFLASTKKVPPPPPLASETFREQVDPHLRQYLGQRAIYMSPFLSLAENPVRALKRISKAEAELPLSFAIFHTPEITEDALARYGKLCLPYPYLVPAICASHELDDLPGNYSGSGEVRYSSQFPVAGLIVWNSFLLGALSNANQLQSLILLKL